MLTQLLHAHPELAVERVALSRPLRLLRLHGELSAYAGDAEHRFAFTWCCAWRARELGWKDCFGFWDQTRAAREYGWRCFERWEPIHS